MMLNFIIKTIVELGNTFTKKTAKYKGIYL